MCTGHALTLHDILASHAAAQLAVAPCHIAVARGCGSLCGRRWSGDEASFDPRDATCPACRALAADFCDCDVIHSAGEITRNTCDRCGGRIE